MNSRLPQRHTVSKDIVPTRLVDYSIGLFATYPTKSSLKKALKKGLISVNGVVTKSDIWVKGREIITLTVAPEDTVKKRLIFPLSVLFEDEYLALIHKPAGILVSGNSFKTIANALSQNLVPSGLEDAVVPQPIHRLDYATTGVLLVGKTSTSIRALGRQFEQKEVAKTYYAVTIGEMKDSGLVNTEIDDKPAQTHFERMASVQSERFEQLNLLELKPETGRRHQIRKHLASIGNPILGDKDYGKEGLILNGKGLYLHAHSLTFRHPVNGHAMTVKSDLPNRFLKIFPDHIL